MPSPSRPATATELMVRYAACHRDQRNIATHSVGIPLIVLAIGVFLARAQFEVGSRHASAAEVLWAVGALWYLTRGNLLLGAATSVATGVLVALAHPFAEASTGSWLAFGLLAFATGWLLQFVGHYYEGRRPAFADDLAGLPVGPMFVTAEALFSVGLLRPLAAEIERRTGPTRIRDLAQPVAGR